MINFRFKALKSLGLATATSATLMAVQPASAGLSEIETTNRNFRVSAPQKTAVVHVVEQKLGKLLELAARYNRYELTFSGEIGGVVRNATLPMELGKLLPRLSRHYDLAWKFDGKHLFVSPASVSEARTLPLEGLGLEKLSKIINEDEINANRFEVMVQDNGRSARLVAPPSHLDAIFAMADRLRK